MATVTGFTAERMLAMEADTVISGTITGDNLILTKKGGGTVSAGNVRGPVGPIGPDGNPTGTIIMGGWAVAPSGYLLLNGATVVGGVATYATLASMYPSWVSGGNLVLPDTLGVVPLGGATPGVVSGSMTHVLAANNLPVHQHVVPGHNHLMSNHNHVVPNHQHTSPDHQHLVNLNSAGMGHHLAARSATADTGFTTGRDTNNDGIQDGSTGTVGGMYVYNIADHGHNVNGMTWWASAGNTTDLSGTCTTGNAQGTNPNDTGWQSGQTTQSPDGATFGVAVNHTPRNLTVRYAVKT